MTERAEFVQKHYPISRTWETHRLEDWLQWAALNKFLATAYDDKELVGLCIFRPLASDKADSYTRPDDQFDENGDVIFIDLTISTRGKPVLQALFFAIMARLGNRQSIAFQIHKRGAELKVHRLSTFRQYLLRS